MEVPDEIARTAPPAIGAPGAPFQFFTCLVLQEATGLRAATLSQLVTLLHQVPESCIYHHTHYALLSYQYLTSQPANDFAFWASAVLGDVALGEQLNGLDLLGFTSLQGLREALISVIERHMSRVASARLWFADEGEEFFFVKSLRVTCPIPYRARTPEELVQCLERVSINSLFHHLVDARLHLGRPTHDVAVWLGEHQGRPDLAEAVTQIDPYANTMEALRRQLVQALRARLGPVG
jgi:hypothetical protein